VKVSAFRSSNGKEGVELAYVGPNVRAMKGARTRRATPIRAEVEKEVQTKRMDKAADLSIGDVLAGLLEAARQTNYSDTLKSLIETEIGREVESWSRWGGTSDPISGLGIPLKSLRRIANGLARLVASGEDHWKLEEEITKAVEKRVTKETAADRMAWIAEHAPSAPA